jgi:cell division protease FtsH
VPFFSLSAAESVEMSAERARRTVQSGARAGAGAFIDDRLGSARARPTAIGGWSEQEQTLNQILTVMDSPAAGASSCSWRRTSQIPDKGCAAGRFVRAVPRPAARRS